MVHFYQHNNSLWLNARVKPQFIHILWQTPKLPTSVNNHLYIKTAISYFYLKSYQCTFLNSL